MKTCPTCHKSKPLEAFARNKSRKDGVGYRCKDCQRQYFKTYYKNNYDKHLRAVTKCKKLILSKNAEFIRTLKEQTPCADCHSKYPAYVMDFDHLSRDKEFNISESAAYSISRARLEAEINKCEIVCANCHRIRTHNRRSGTMVHVV